MYKMEGHYQEMVELQQKLRKSEEERYKLEEKFNEMMRITRDTEQERLRSLRHKYNKFIEADRRRQERNGEIFRALDRIETRASALAAKTDRYRHLRKKYAIYLKTKQNEQPQQKLSQEINFQYPTCRKKLFPENIEESYDSKVAKSKINMLEQYIRENNDTEKFLNNLATKITDKPTSKTNYDQFLDKVIKNSTYNDRISQEPRFVNDGPKISNGLQRFPNYQFDERRNVQKDDTPYPDRYFCHSDLLNNERYKENITKPIINVEMSKDEVDTSNRYQNHKFDDNKEANQRDNHETDSSESAEIPPDVSKGKIIVETSEKHEEIIRNDTEKILDQKEVESENKIEEVVKEKNLENLQSPTEFSQVLKNNAEDVPGKDVQFEVIEEVDQHEDLIPTSVDDIDKVNLPGDIEQNVETKPKEYQSFEVLPKATEVKTDKNMFQPEETDKYYPDNVQSNQFYEQSDQLHEQSEQLHVENEPVNEQKEQEIYSQEQNLPLEQNQLPAEQNYPQYHESTEEYNQKEQQIYNQPNAEYSAEENQNYPLNPDQTVEDSQYIPENQGYQQIYSEETPQNYEYPQENNVYQQPNQEFDENAQNYENYDQNYQEQPQNQQYIQEGEDYLPEQQETFEEGANYQQQQQNQQYIQQGEDYIPEQQETFEEGANYQEQQQNQQYIQQGEDYPPEQQETFEEGANYQEQPQGQQYIPEGAEYPAEGQFVQEKFKEGQNYQEQQLAPEQPYQEGYDQQYHADQVNYQPTQENYDPNQENFSYQQDPNQEGYDPSYQYEQGYTQENPDPQYPTEEFQQNIDPNQQYEYPTDQQYVENVPYDENYQQNYEQTPEQVYTDVSDRQIGQPLENVEQVLEENIKDVNFEDSSVSDNVGNIDAILDVNKEDVAPKSSPNLGKLLESDTESSFKQDTKVSNDSDFDFSQNN